jgi:type I restriction enzyme S subunit
MIGQTIPEGWVSVALGAIATIERRPVPPGAIPSSMRSIGLEHLDGTGRILPADTVPHVKPASTKFRFGPEHILYGKLRPYLCKIARADFVGVASTDILPIRPGRQVDRSFLYHYLRHPWMVEYATARAEGANLPRVSPRTLEAMPIFLPPLSEQRRIGSILDQVESIWQKRREGLRLAGELLPGAFLELFGDPALEGHRGPAVALGEYVANIQYGTSAKANEEGRGLPVLRMNNITESGDFDLTDMKWCEIPIEKREAFTVRRGDLLFNRTNSPKLVGKTAVWHREEHYAFAGYLVRVRFDESRLLPEYVSAFLNSGYGKRLLLTRARPSVNMSNFSAGEFRKIPLVVPEMEAQRHFRQVVWQMQALRERQREQVEQAGELLRGLVQRAFRGEL